MDLTNEDYLMVAPTSATLPGNSWWERVVVQRSAGAIENLVEDAIQKSKFLASDLDSNNSIALLKREEVRLGELLGTGTYSNVYQVSGFDMQDMIVSRCSLSEQDEVEDDDGNNDDGGADRAHLQQSTLERYGGAQYAIKHLKPELLKESKGFESAATDLILEAKFLSRLRHANILRIRGIAIGEASAFRSGFYDSFFIITDRVQETLIQRIRRWKKASAGNSLASAAVAEEDMIVKKMEIALQVGRALEYLHARRLVYRDLKPHNIGLLEDDTVLLFDFGFCREIPSTKEVSCVGGDYDDDAVLHFMSGKGTLLYMAPEVLGARRFNQKADVYSWAVMFYEMLTLSRPYPNRSFEQHRRALVERNERPQLLNSIIPFRIQHLLENCWAENVVQRFRMSDACNQLETILADYQEGQVFDIAESIIGVQVCLMCNLSRLVSSFVTDVQTGYHHFVKTEPPPTQEQHHEEEDLVSTVLPPTTTNSTPCTKEASNGIDASQTKVTSEESTSPDIMSPTSSRLSQEREDSQTSATIEASPKNSQTAQCRVVVHPAPFACNGKLIYHKFYGRPLGVCI